MKLYLEPHDDRVFIIEMNSYDLMFWRLYPPNPDPRGTVHDYESFAGQTLPANWIAV